MVFLRKDRTAIGRTALALMTIVVVVVGGAIGISYPKSGQAAPAISTTAPSSISTSSSTALSSTPSSSVSSNTQTTSHTPSAPLFNFVLDSEPRTILLYPGANLNYTTILIVPSANKLQGIAPGNRGVGSELVAVNATAPSGLSLHFFGSNLTSRVYIEVGAGGDEGLLVELTAAQSIAPGDYTIAIEGTSGTLSVYYSLPVRVAQYLVIANYNAFSPSTLNVKVGSTVFWLNLDSGNEGTYDVVFDTIGVHSPVLNPAPVYDTFSHTFTTAGSYSYHCSACMVQVGGTIIVTG